MSKLSKADKEAFQAILEKHQKKHPGCKLSERRCRYELSEECIGKADQSEFKGTAFMCKNCTSAYNHAYYEKKKSKKKSKKRTSSNK